TKFLAANGQSSGHQCICPPNKPLVVPSSGQGDSVCIAPLKACTAEEQQTLSHLSHYAGGAATMGLANLLWDTKIAQYVGDLNTFGGNGMGAAAAQSNRVLSAINDYDLANKRYEDLKNHRASPAMINSAKMQADAAFKKMNRVLNDKSLNYLNNNTFGMRQTTNAAGRTVWESIPVADTADVRKLTGLAKVARVAGPGVVVFDGYLRASSVHRSWKNNDPNWQRKAVVEGSSFGLGILAGAVIGTVIAVTPVGLAIGIVVAGATAVGVDYAVKDFAGWMYDQW
ncbi:hypothetical protein, partial [uncultured Marinobacter sp.]|uniref:hypothetical protein n=1 Tax=uncultured Marinobacter sp. TaxID=187379 RepID=UPI0030D98586